MIFTVAWWVMGGWFLVWEGVALSNKKPGDTLSEHVWKYFYTYRGSSTRPNALQRLRRFALLAFMAWLSAHFLTGGRF